MNDRHIEHTYTKDKVFNVVNVVTQELVFFEAVLIDTLFLLLTNNYAYARKVFLQPFFHSILYIISTLHIIETTYRCQVCTYIPLIAFNTLTATLAICDRPRFLL